MCSNLKYALLTTVGILAILAIFGIIVCMH
ncbi:YnhF family membrane protein [Gilliamella sp. Pra-s65]|nr:MULTISPECIES: YnhF family membrane protein [unclassified Gilliamella]MWP45992.1 YnhF family membrane protein [Gilliamella sp. Pas-s27]MWN31598.1 YnhF family membrane protein [Gilliamella sp. Pra-s60]MWN89355.1 YnhF family membrane protein [Gilliamella sp. Pra-s65]MWP28705.1 YnhF family membrane protein [Gilliamella sp. Pra-s54]MWP72398.1 YnhF family membrane protein [Gilliamella sp. Pra-s52]